MIALSPLSSLGPAEPAGRLPRPAAAAGRDFAGVLDTARELDAAAQERAKAAADQLVASALVMPILAEARSAANRGGLFHGGRGEEVFGQQLDTILADRIASSPGFGLGAAVAGRLGGGAGATPTGSTVNRHG